MSETIDTVAAAICDARFWSGAWAKANEVEKTQFRYEARAAIEAAKWRPIETAPKNGYIIGAWPDGSRWWAAQLHWDDMQESWVHVFSDRLEIPTKWMPLPKQD